MPEEKKEVKLPEGYGAAAPKGAAVYAKKGENYIAFLARCRKAGNDMKQCSAIWKKGEGGEEKESPKGARRKRAARILRRKKA